MKSYPFGDFLQPGCPILLRGSFRDNAKRYLENCNELQEMENARIKRWCTFLVHEDHIIPLYTFEESIDSNTIKPNCQHCQYAGWSSHFVSKKRYHFIIPMNNDWNKDIKEDDHSYILHGLVHCNGFGHLLCVNRMNDGLCGGEIMGLWERICTTLRVRKISVVDTSRKRNMELRLLYGISYGHTWFGGRWGYKLSHGSFGATKPKYEEAVQKLRNLNVDDMIQNTQITSIKETLSRYRDLTNTNLATIGELFGFMLPLRFDSSQIKDEKKGSSTVPRKFCDVAAESCKNWTVSKLQVVASVAVEVLDEKKSQNQSRVSRDELRNAITSRPNTKGTGLVDHVLKLMNNVTIGGYVVRRSKRIPRIEYTIEETTKSGFGSTLYTDLADLYRHLISETRINEIQVAVKTVMDSKFFIKDWPFEDPEDDYLRFHCRVIPYPTDLYRFRNSVCEEVVVPLLATFDELKVATEIAMRDTYCIMENLEVREIVEPIAQYQDNDPIFEKLQSGWEIRVRGPDKVVVKCSCGANDVDGEEMVQCHHCNVSMHVTCIRVDHPQVDLEDWTCEKHSSI